MFALEQLISTLWHTCHRHQCHRWLYWDVRQPVSQGQKMSTNGMTLYEVCLFAGKHICRQKLRCHTACMRWSSSFSLWPRLRYWDEIKEQHKDKLSNASSNPPSSSSIDRLFCHINVFFYFVGLSYERPYLVLDPNPHHDHEFCLCVIHCVIHCKLAGYNL